MKTSILVSSIAAFFLMITFGGTPGQKEVEESNMVMAHDFTIYKTNMLSHATAVAPATDIKAKTEPATPAIESEDFSYLKFNVAAYLETEQADNEDNIELPATESDYSYLKFNVDDYMEAEFDYLKFDVSDYTSGSLNSTENIELPLNELEYLKFDVNNYMTNSVEVESDELPEDEFDYLKFDVNKFYASANINSLDTIELPANE
jgi:hypothetical protein